MRVGAGATIGSAATILGGFTIGAGAMIGAGAVVTHDVPAEATVTGNPAVPLPAGEAVEPGRRVDPAT